MEKPTGTSFPQYLENLKYIDTPDVRAAFRYLSEQLGDLSGCEARLKRHGYMEHNYHYYKGKSLLFAFTVNKQSLLFYLCKPKQTHPKYSVNVINKLLPQAQANALHHGEITFKIRSQSEAQSAMNLLFASAQQPRDINYPDELVIPSASRLLEGAAKSVLINSYERNIVARQACIDHYGHRCTVCDLSFEEVYGILGKQFIHVHHLVEISSIGREYVVDPIKDLRPVCPNCHAMLHRRVPALTIAELKMILQLSRNG